MFKPCRSAQKGRRIVAAGGAQPAARRAERNPWKKCVIDRSAPAGRRSPWHARGVRRTHIAPRTSRRRSFLHSFAPPGRKEKKECLFPEDFHGFRVGSPRDRAAPPVAIFLRPVGAKDKNALMMSPRFTDGGRRGRKTRLGCGNAGPSTEEHVGSPMHSQERCSRSQMVGVYLLYTI
jgi:hypothetical protein